MNIKDNPFREEILWVWQAVSQDDTRPAHLAWIRATKNFIEAADGYRVHRVNRHILEPGMWYRDGLCYEVFNQVAYLGEYPDTQRIIDAALLEDGENFDPSWVREMAGINKPYTTIKTGRGGVMLNSRFLIEALKGIPKDGTVFASSPSRPVIIAGGGQLACVMPVRYV